VIRPSRAVFGLVFLASLLLASPTAAANNTPPHDGSTLTKPVALSTSSWTTVLTSTLQTSQKRNLQASGWLDLVNTGSKPVVVTLRFFDKAKGSPIDIHAGRERVTVQAHSRASAPLQLLCNGEPAGTYVLGVQARSSGPVTVRAGSETALALPSPGNAGALPNAGIVSTTAHTLGTSDITLLKVNLFNGSAVSTAAAEPVNALATAAIDFNGGSQPAMAMVDFFIDGQRVRTVKQSIPANGSVAILASVQGNLTGGEHSFVIRGRASIPGPHVGFGALTVVGLPTDGSIPNHASFGDGSVHPLDTKPQPFFKQTLKTGSVSDVWTGGWLTIHNPLDKRATITVQAAFNGSAEGPSMIVTAPAHSNTTIPAGLIGLLVPAGSTVLELLVSSSIIGPDFNGDGVVASFALPQ
jgi:hypothetical protein